MNRLALCAAQLLADEVDAWGMPVLRGLLPIAGMTVIEQQAERLKAAGLSRMLLLVDAVPGALAEACDRIVARGLSLDLVRGSDDVLALVENADQILLVADGLIAGDTAWSQVANTAQQSLLVTQDTPMTQGLERIDATTRWAGLALIDARMFDALNDAPEGWDPQLFLFRHAVQCGVERLECSPALFVTGEMIVAQTPVEAEAAEQRILSSKLDYEFGAGERWIVGPLLHLFTSLLLKRQSSGKLARSLTPILAIGSMVGALSANFWAAAGLGLAAAVAHQAARTIVNFRPETRIWAILGTVGLIAQFIALAVADRESHFGSINALLGGRSSSLTILLILLYLSQSGWARPRWNLRRGILPDLALTWMVLVGLMPIFGWTVAFDIAAFLGIIAIFFTLIAMPSKPEAKDIT
ncbi:MAG: hypothetical protein ABL909_07675 [Sphingopyxis sp.]